MSGEARIAPARRPLGQRQPEILERMARIGESVAQCLRAADHGEVAKHNHGGGHGPPSISDPRPRIFERCSATLPRDRTSRMAAFVRQAVALNRSKGDPTKRAV